jgi:hypothetical protein
VRYLAALAGIWAAGEEQSSSLRRPSFTHALTLLEAEQPDGQSIKLLQGSLRRNRNDIRRVPDCRRANYASILHRRS